MRALSIVFLRFVNMLDDAGCTVLSKDMIFALSERDWLVVAWNCAVEKIVSGRTKVLSTNRGIWRIQCDTMETVSELSCCRQVLLRLHQLNDIRQLPPIRAIAPVPPLDMSSPIAMLRAMPYREMPEALWRQYAWNISVDAVTSETTSICSIKNGVWTIKCRSQHAAEFLRNDERVRGMIWWLNRIRALPEMNRIVVLMADMAHEQTVTDGNKCHSLDETEVCEGEPELPDGIRDRELRRMLMRLKKKGAS